VKKIKAFSLIEISLTLILIGIFSSFIFPFYKKLNYNRSCLITINKANEIRRALEGYVAMHGFLPSAANKDGLQIENKNAGYVPYKTLGLTSNHLKDGFGKNFKYFVSHEFTKFKYKKRIILPVFFPLNIAPILNNFTKPYYHFSRIYRYGYVEPLKEKKEKKNIKRKLYYDDDLQKDYVFKEGFNFYADDASYDFFSSDKVIDLCINNSPVQLKHTSIYNFFHNYQLYDLPRYPIENFSPNLQEIFPNPFWNCDTVFYKAKSEYKDCICYALISTGFQLEKIELEYYQNESFKTYITKGIIFWQSRFNIAGFTKHPATTASLDVKKNFKLIISATEYFADSPDYEKIQTDKGCFIKWHEYFI